jgi:hypothetical protein
METEASRVDAILQQSQGEIIGGGIVDIHALLDRRQDMHWVFFDLPDGILRLAKG